MISCLSVYMFLVHEHSCFSKMVGFGQFRRRTQSHSEGRLEAQALSFTQGKIKGSPVIPFGISFVSSSFSVMNNHLESKRNVNLEI